MSAFTNWGKSPLLGLLKNVFTKSDAQNTIPDQIAFTAPPTVIAPPPKPVVRATGNVPAPARSNGNGNGHGNGNGGKDGEANFNGIAIPLQVIIDTLPLELRDKVREPNVGGLTVPVAFDKILSQLAQGVVKVPFGDIREAAPYAFVPGIESDRLPVTLPLQEILSRLNPALLVRRNAQKQVAVPAEIVSPFDARGAGQSLSVGNAKPVTAAPRTAAPSPVVPPTVPGRGSLSSVPTPPPPSASASVTPVTPVATPRHAITPKPATPPAPPAEPVALNSMTPIPMSPIPMIKPLAPTPPPAPTPTPALRIVPPAPPAVPAPAAITPPAIPLIRAPQPPVPAPREIPSPKPVTETATLSAGLTALAESWPEPVQQEIVQLKLLEAQVALPAETIEVALKRGRVMFAWKVIRAWIRPLPAASASSHDETELELPLKVIAPLFLARQASNKPAQSLAIDEAIPNLFFGFPKPDATGALPSADAKMAAATDTNFYVFDDSNETSRLEREDVAKKRKSPTGTEFVAKYATPNEIVSRAASLDGVAGALIALPDGLMVASRVPAELNGDTLAAFLPQIFSKVSMCTKELRMGDLNNLNFTVGNVPWKIFRVNAIFFAAFGRAAEALPTAQLAALAAELDRKHK